MTRIDGSFVKSELVDGQDSQWAPYVSYLRPAIARIQKQWERELLNSRVAPPIGVTVTVVFFLSPEGRVSRIEQVKSEPESVGTKACLSAITQAGTFGPWTEEMKKRLTADEKLTFTFRYEK